MLRRTTAAFGLLYSCAAFAQMAAHEHGVASLNLALEGSMLLIEFESPLADIAGFEHAPKTDADREALASALSLLEDGQALFALSPQAGCALREVQVTSPFETKEDDGHDAAHANEHGDANAHEDHAQAAAHVDIDAAWTFECATPDAVTGVEISLFDVFRELRVIRAKTATPNGQRAMTLDRSHLRLPL